jgi:hypothetical protein
MSVPPTVTSSVCIPAATASVSTVTVTENPSAQPIAVHEHPAAHHPKAAITTSGAVLFRPSTPLVMT